jgi:hypothetical protein
MHLYYDFGRYDLSYEEERQVQLIFVLPACACGSGRLSLPDGTVRSIECVRQESEI